MVPIKVLVVEALAVVDTTMDFTIISWELLQTLSQSHKFAIGEEVTLGNTGTG